MGLDISNILRDWPYEPGKVTARRICGSDGKDKIQLRLDFGLLQMEVTGRPDGQRPYGFESFLDYYEHQLAEYRRIHGSDEGFVLKPKACDKLRCESVMYYHRYLAEFVLEEYQTVVEDTARNLRLMDFCLEFGREPEDRTTQEQYRPYVFMMNTRARSQCALEQCRPKAALAIIKRGISRISEFYVQNDQFDAVEESGEIDILRGVAEEIETIIPCDPVKSLERELAEAVQKEWYEKAAMLRDQLDRVREGLPVDDISAI